MFTKPPDRPTSLANVSDGTSTTAMMAEWTLGTLRKTDFQPRRVVYATPTPLIKPQEFDRFLESCLSVSGPSNAHFVWKGESWLLTSFGYTQYNHNLTVNNKSCLNHHFLQEGTWSSGSFHGSGANVLFADGRVTFVYDTIALPLWRALGTRSGSEVVDSLR
jgi:prepilin-type processing-associated H-X9-DG protein